MSDFGKYNINEKIIIKGKNGGNMLKKDIMKEIENSLKIVREKIDEAKINGNTKEAFDYINKELKSLVGLNINTIDTISFLSIKDMISRDNESNAEKYIALGSLLRYQGYLYDNGKDNGSAVYYYYKSLQAFNEGLKKDKTIEGTYGEDMSIVLDQLSKYELSISENETIFEAYELLGSYDKAEDTLYYMMHKDKKNNKLIDLGIDFYERLKEKPEEDLIEGNLPIEEVEDGLKHLENISSEQVL